MEIITYKTHACSEKDIYNNSPDSEYMKKCHDVDMNPPSTWEKYDMTKESDVRKVIEMEYRELMMAGTGAEQAENIYHLSVALLRMWRLINKEK